MGPRVFAARKHKNAKESNSPRELLVGSPLFDALTDRLSSVFDRLSGRGVLSEKDVAEVMREIRVALLEADVALRWCATSSPRPPRPPPARR